MRSDRKASNESGSDGNGAYESVTNEKASTGRHPATPDDLTITAREIHFDYEKAMRENPYWHSNDPVLTHFFNALQSTFPEGERFFIDSARDARDQYGKENLSDRLNEDIGLFIKQEAFHGREHEAWNKALINLGYGKIAKFDQKIKDMRLWAKENAPAYSRLAGTAAAEHYTASLGHIFLNERPELIKGAAKPFQYLLSYHALEEIEHKAVCFDLYQEVSGNYLSRIFGIVFTSFDLMHLVRARQIYLLKKDGLWNFKNRIKAWQFVWGSKGMVWTLLPYFLNYFRPDFHPWETDERSKLNEIFGDIYQEMGIVGVSEGR